MANGKFGVLFLLTFITKLSSLAIKTQLQSHNKMDTAGSASDTQCFGLYLSTEGSNSRNCGRKNTTPCETLNHLLHIFHSSRKHERPEHQSGCINLITDSSFTIDQHIQKNHPWIKRIKLNVSSLYYSEKKTLTFNNLNITGGNWSIHNVRTKIKNSDLSAMNLTITFPIQQKHKTSVRISRCTLGKIQIYNAREVVIHDSSANNLNTSEESLFTFKNSVVKIWNSSFLQNSGDSLITVLKGTVLSLANTTFKDNCIKGGTLFADQSTVYVSNSRFDKNLGLTNGDAVTNGGCINALNGSNISITASTFSENAVSGSGGVAYISENVHLSISDSLFFKNFAKSAGVLAVYKHSTVFITHSNFTSNEGVSYTGTIKVYEDSSLTLQNSALHHNTVQQSVGVLAAGENSTLEVFDCSFVNNTSQLKNAAAIYLEVDAKILIKRSKFIQNRAAQIGGVLNLYKKCSAEIHDSLFDGNSAGDSSGVFNIVDRCTLTLINSTFINNNAAFSGGVLASNGNDQVHVKNCAFRNNTAFTGEGGSIFVGNNCNLTVSQSTFDQNKSGYKGGAISILYSQANITNCSFDKNNASIFAGVLEMEKSNVTINWSNFTENKAKSEGGVIAARECSVKISNSNFKGNKAVYRAGGVMTIEHLTTLHVSNSNFTNNSAAYTGGIIVASGTSRITFENVQATSNSAQIGAGLSLQPHTKFKAINCTFLENYASGYAGVLFLSFNSEADMANCSFERNSGRAMAGVAYVIRGTLKLSRTTLKHNHSPKGKSFYFFGKYDNHILTYKTLFVSDTVTANSDNKDMCWNLLRKANEIWIDPSTKFENTETSFASVVPEQCEHGCSCYYDSVTNLNVFNCSSRNLTNFPLTIPYNTSLLDLSRNNLQNMQDIHLLPYFPSLQHIDLSNNNITEFETNLVHFLGTIDCNVTFLNLEGNKIEKLPKLVTEMGTRTKLKLGRNPYHCDCSMFWMQAWLQKLTQTECFLLDATNLTCGPGPFTQLAIYELDKEALGCSGKWYWIVILASISVSIFITIALIVHRNWKRIQFLLFVHFNILTTDDGVENLDKMLYDGFVSYSREDQLWVITEVMNYLEESHGFRICIHQRDFTIGSPIICNITDSILHSRRMILVLSRNFIKSGWCMEEFRIAHEQVVSGRKRFLIPILLEDIKDLEMPDDLRLYLDTYTYLEVQASDSLTQKKLRYAMPRAPLKELKRLPPRREYKRIRSSTSSGSRAEKNTNRCSSDDDSDHDTHNGTSPTLSV